MPKVRTLDPEFWDDTVIDALPRDERLLAAALITLLADDEGRFIAEPSVIKKRVFGLDKDMTPAKVEAMLAHMAKAWPNFRLYRANAQIYGVLINFAKRQGIRYVVKSKLPEYDKSFDLNDCGNLPQIAENSRRVGLSRVEKSRVEERATRVPDPFPLTEELKAWAGKEFPSVDIEAQTPAFVDYWRGVPGVRGLKTDWPATWRNDVRRCAEMGKHARRRSSTPPKPEGPSEWEQLYALQQQKGAK